MRSCEACGKELPAGSVKAKRFCDGTCRKRAHRVPKNVVDLPVAESSVAAATLATLTGAGRLDHPAGAAALVLAARIDAGTDTGSALASMTRELRAALADATAGGEVQADGVDEIRAQAEKRRRRLASSGGR